MLELLGFVMVVCLCVLGLGWRYSVDLSTVLV